VFQTKRGIQRTTNLKTLKKNLPFFIILNQSSLQITTMRRTTLGSLNIGNQPRQVREKKMSFGARPSTGGRLSTSGRPSMNSKR
jgi:hypothetical protein